ncbi:MAG: bifunctional homocysteine S-methyltransferase/methylenetetrahydrofolate reductase [Anaerolineaceae bacterium]|nr:bifunctional homocysteine S-methyltransferase/methylenetetrahydrofolate reductase [Anaerolineaceae bacterium]
MKKGKYQAFRAFLEQSPPLLSDGATGTMLNQRGLSIETCMDALNLEQPAVVAEVHRLYIESGARMIQTNTFGANRFKLERYNLQDKLGEINIAGVNLAQKTAEASFKDIFIVGDIGPLGARLAPFGKIQQHEARQVFYEQAKFLVEAGVDAIIVETISDLNEILQAIQGVKNASTEIPIIASMTFTRDDRTLLGDNPVKVAQEIAEANVDVIGINCSGGPNQILRILRTMRQAVPTAKFSVMPNAGWPESVDGRFMYPATSDYFGQYALTFWKAGASIIGGCCGTTPAHIKSMADQFKQVDFNSVPLESIVESTESTDISLEEQPTELCKKINAGKFVIAIEMDPPKGLSTHKLLAGASLLKEAGADVINVADSPMARMRMSPWAVCHLVQDKLDIETVLHFPTRGRNLLRVQGDLLAAHALGVRNIFVVMGDPTAIGDYPEAMDQYDLVPSGLVKLIKQEFNLGIDHTGHNIGQRTNFVVGSALSLNPKNPEKEIKTLKRKLDNGTDFFLTQPVYNPAKAQQFLQQAQDNIGKISAPIFVGMLPLASIRHATFLNQEVPGIQIPDSYLQLMQKAENSPQKDEKVRTGIKIATELIEEMRSFVQGVYLMPAFHRYDVAAEIIETIRAAD